MMGADTSHHPPPPCLGKPPVIGGRAYRTFWDKWGMVAWKPCGGLWRVESAGGPGEGPGLSWAL